MRYFKLIHPKRGDSTLYITDNNMKFGSWYDIYKKRKELLYKLRCSDIDNLTNVEGCENSFKEITENEDLFLEFL